MLMEAHINNDDINLLAVVDDDQHLLAKLMLTEQGRQQQEMTMIEDLVLVFPYIPDEENPFFLIWR